MAELEYTKALDTFLAQHPEIDGSELLTAPEFLNEFNLNNALVGRTCIQTVKNPRTGEVHCIEWSDD